jgi:hypothetical protein
MFVNEIECFFVEFYVFFSKSFFCLQMKKIFFFQETESGKYQVLFFKG